MTAIQALAQGSKHAAPFPLHIYMNGVDLIPVATLAPAEAIASEMLAVAGVHVIWHHRTPHAGESPRENTMLVRIVNDKQPDAQSGPIASAQVYQGQDILLYYSRIKWAEREQFLGPRVLAHALVHEIVHNLQGVARHSASGVMKATWTGSDYYEMEKHNLDIEPADLELIQIGLNHRRAHAGDFIAKN
jgi:hypothetical protein